MESGDRRKTPRITLRQLAQASGSDAETGERSELMGTTADISEGGVRFEAGQGFREGSEVSISFAVGEDIVEATGRVIHFTPQDDGTVGMGIQFLGLSESDKRFIENYCRSKAD